MTATVNPAQGSWPVGTVPFATKYGVLNNLSTSSPRGTVFDPYTSPDALYINNEQGLWLDPSDFSTLFQDSAGTTPVTAVEQPVGLILDKSKGLVLGAELVTNGGFDTDVSGWTVTAGATLSWETGRLKSVTTSVLGPLQQLTLVVGKRYKVVGTVQGPVSNNVSLGILNNAEAAFIAETSRGYRATATELTLIFVASETNSKVYMRCGGVGTFYLDNISVRELPGNHATQATSTKRPVLSARKNWLLATETLSTQNVTVLAGQMVLSFYGTGTVTLSGTSTAGPLVGTGASDRVSLTFTPTAGTLTLTVSGSVTQAQLEYVA